METQSRPRQTGLGEDRAGRQIATALGWFSIGLGVTQLLVPGKLARLIGIRDRSSTRHFMRAMGLREIGHGVAILTKPQSAPRVWARVGGDVLDTAALGSAMTSSKNDRGRLSGALAAVLGVAALDLYDSIRLSDGRHVANGRSLARRIPKGRVHVKKTLTIRRPIDEVYGFWRDFKNLPRFMNHLESVETEDEGRSHWKTHGPADTRVEWDAEIVADEPNSRIEWRTLPGADIRHVGSIRFAPAPGDRGTEVRVDLRYDAPAGKAGAVIARLFGEDPAQQVQDDLHAFKQVMETGEVVRSEGSMRGRYLQHPAQLPESESRSS